VLEFKFLGQTAVRLDGLEVHLPTKKSLALLAYLALQGETERSRLAALLWGRLGAERARKNLRQELYRLSSSKLGTSLELSSERVALKLPIYSDVQQFRELLVNEDFAQALEISRAGLLADWRSAGSYEFQHWLEAERQTLQDLRRQALAQHAFALENSGAYREALAAHLELLGDDELQEHHHVAVMRLHLNLGERLLALEQFKRLSRILKREVGLEPLPETLALVERIRSNEALEETTANNAPQPAANVVPPLIEREHILGQLERSKAKILVLMGEAGVGKSRLALEFAGQGLKVFGREDSSGTPFAPFAQMIRNTTQQNPDALDSLEPVWRHELARLIPEIEPSLTLNEAVPEARSRFLEGVARAVVLLAGHSNMMLDDLQYFDTSSLEVIGLLARRGLMAGQRIVATVRGTDLHPPNQIAVLLNALEREGLLERFELEPLSESGVQALVATLSQLSPDAALIRFLYAATGGNPLYALESLRALLESNTEAEGLGQPEFPGSLSQVVHKRIQALGASVKRLLEAASVAGNGFALEWLEEASALTDWEALESLERATQSGLIEAQTTAGETRGYRFAHDLVRQAILESLGMERERLVHRKLAGALETHDAPSERIALHLERSGQAKRAVQHRIRAAQAASAVFAYREALEHYARALEDGASLTDAFAIRLARVKQLQKLDDRSHWDAEIAELERAATKLPDPSFEAAALLARADYEFLIGRYERSLDLARLAFTRLQPSDPQASHALYREGTALFRQSRLSEAKACFEAALELCSDHDFDQLGEIYIALSRCVIDQGDLIAAQMYNDLASNAYHRANRVDGEVMALNARGWIAFLRNELDTALGCLVQALERARELGWVLLQRGIIINLSAVLMTSGQLERAVPLLEEGLQLAREPQEPRLEALFHTHLAHVAERRGELQGFLEHFRKAIDIFDRVGATSHAIHARLNMAQFFLICGDPKQAEAQLEVARQGIKAMGISQHDAWLEGLSVRRQLLLNHTPKTEKLERAILANDKPDLQARLDLARAKLALGDGAETIEIAASLERPPAIRAEALSLQLQALVSLNHRSVAPIEEAQKLLNLPEIAPLNKLSLYQALIATFGHLRNLERANALRQDAERLMAQLASSLEPEVRERFTAHWAEILGKNATLRTVR
jgi:DNA-binding SARP family transcriptional activator/tetratricopeptide (TPR) repeat protein